MALPKKWARLQGLRLGAAWVWSYQMHPLVIHRLFKGKRGQLLPVLGQNSACVPATTQADQKSTEVFPGGWAPIVRATPHGLARGVIDTQKDDDADESHVPDHEAVWAVFGLIPQWAKDTKICRSTYNARSETVADKPSFKAAWARHQHCIVPAESITEPNYATDKAVPARIDCADGLPVGIAGL